MKVTSKFNSGRFNQNWIVNCVSASIQDIINVTYRTFPCGMFVGCVGYAALTMLDCTLLPFLDPLVYMYSPAWLDPTKLIAFIAGWSQINFTAAKKDKYKIKRFLTRTPVIQGHTVYLRTFLLLPSERLLFRAYTDFQYLDIQHFKAYSFKANGQTHLSFLRLFKLNY